MRKITCLAVVPLLAGGLATAQDARPTFAEPAFKGAASCPMTLKGVRSPQNQILSILQVTKDTTEPQFLAVGDGHGRHAKSFCTLEIRMARLKSAQRLSLDVRGGEQKDANSVLSVALRIGSTEHKSDYAKGRWFESQGSELRRYVVQLKPGTTSVRIALSGTATSHDGKAIAFYDFDTMDLCFVDPDRPQDCAASGQPNPSAANSPDR
jgi:hypothetical protein